MPARALLVLLVILNFGVAIWWLLHPGPLPPTPWVQPEGVPALQLLAEAEAAEPTAAQAPEVEMVGGEAAGADAAQPGERADVAAPAPASVVEATAASAPADPARASGPAALRCMSFGPYDDAASVATARDTLQPLGAAQTRVRDVVDASRGWRVLMAPQPDRAAADALAGRIRDAGFDDLLVIPSGDEANGIALGLYSTEAAARRRESSLRAAGFPAQAKPLGDGTTRHWLDLAAGPAFDAAAARRAAGAREMRGIDCAGVVAVAAR